MAQTSPTWHFPLQNGLTINFIDTVVLQWTSNYNGHVVPERLYW
jgi:hypothetical protein